MKTYIFKREDGHIAIFYMRDGANIDECVRKFSQTAFTPTEVVPADEVALPERNEYRNAWVFGDGKVETSIDKAREVHKDILRRQRAPLLEKLDVDISRALAQGKQQEVARLEAERQRLRDVTAKPEIAAAKTIDDLRKVTVG